MVAVGSVVLGSNVIGFPIICLKNVTCLARWDTFLVVYVFSLSLLFVDLSSG